MNWGAEIYFQWYPNRSRRWFFVGGLISLDGFEMRPESGGETQTSIALYVAPRVGIRIPIFVDYIFFEPSFGAAIRVFDSGPTIGDNRVRTQVLAPITFLSLGGTIP